MDFATGRRAGGLAAGLAGLLAGLVDLAALGLAVSAGLLSTLPSVALVSAAGPVSLGLVSGASSAPARLRLDSLSDLKSGFVPAAALEAEHRRRNQLLHGRLAAGGTLLQRRVADLASAPCRTCSWHTRIHRKACNGGIQAKPPSRPTGVKVSRPSRTPTWMVSPAAKSPRRMCCARGFSICCWMARFSGRAP